MTEPIVPVNLLTDEEKAVFEWQMWIPDLGQQGQQRLKDASVMISRVGGVGSVVAYELAAAGVGKLVLAHAGNVKPSDLNRQLLMTHDWIGKPRIESIRRRLLDLNPRLEIVSVAEIGTPRIPKRFLTNSPTEGSAIIPSRTVLKVIPNCEPEICFRRSFLASIEYLAARDPSSTSSSSRDVRLATKANSVATKTEFMRIKKTAAKNIKKSI